MMQQNIAPVIFTQRQTIINESGTDDVFESVYNMIISNRQKSFGKSVPITLLIFQSTTFYLVAVTLNCQKN